MKWFRLYSGLLHNRKVQSLPSALFKSWINILCFASGNGDRGRISSVEDLAFALRVKPSKARKIVDQLLARNLLENGPNASFFVHDWDDFQQKSDDSRPRVDRFRNQNGTPDSSGNNDLGSTCNGQCNALEQNRTDKDKDKDSTTPLPPSSADAAQVADATGGQKSGATNGTPKPPGWLDAAIWNAFSKHRAKLGRPIDGDAARLCFDALAGMRQRGHDTNAILKTSIVNGWSALVEPKTPNHETHHIRPQPRTLPEESRAASRRLREREGLAPAKGEIIELRATRLPD